MNVSNVSNSLQTIHWCETIKLIRPIQVDKKKHLKNPTSTSLFLGLKNVRTSKRDNFKVLLFIFYIYIFECVERVWLNLVKTKPFRSDQTIAEPWVEGDEKKWFDVECGRRADVRPGILGCHSGALSGPPTT